MEAFWFDGDAQYAPVGLLSGGERRRLQLLVTLAEKPNVLLLDEPTTGLDPRSRLELWSVIEDLVRDGTTVLLTTQYLEEADKLADDIVVIDKGKVIARGTSEELKQDVGGDRLEVVVPAELLDAAADALRPIADGPVQVDGVERLVKAPVSGGSTILVDAVRRLDEGHVHVEDIVLRRPTLDDVFMSLTGHGAQDDAKETDA